MTTGTTKPAAKPPAKRAAKKSPVPRPKPVTGSKQRIVEHSGSDLAPLAAFLRREVEKGYRVLNVVGGSIEGDAGFVVILEG